MNIYVPTHIQCFGYRLAKRIGFIILRYPDDTNKAKFRAYRTCVKLWTASNVISL